MEAASCRNPFRNPLKSPALCLTEHNAYLLRWNFRAARKKTTLAVSIANSTMTVSRVKASQPVLTDLGRSWALPSGAVPKKYIRYCCANHFAVCYHDRHKKADLL